MTKLIEPPQHRSTATSRCQRGHRLGRLLLGAALLSPGTLLAQTPTEVKSLPGFSQTAEAPPTPPAAVAIPATEVPRPSPVPVAAPTLPRAQRRCSCDWVRDGFYLRISSSVEPATFSGSGPSGSAKISGLGGGSSIAIGGSVVRGLVVAGMIRSTAVTSNFNGGPYADAQFSAKGETLTVTRKALASSSQIGAVIDWYPMEEQGLHVGLSGGLNMLTVNNHADESTWHGFGAGGSLFVGYDWPLASTLALGVSLVVSGATSSSLKDQDSKDTGYKLSPFSVGLAGSLLFF